MKKEYRIKREKDFHTIIKRKKSFANRQFVIYHSPNQQDHFRLGISVSKKLGKAHKRNKLKRYVREAIKQHKDRIVDRDIIIIIRAGAVNISFEDFVKSINHILRNTKLLKI
ncbi:MULTISPECIES: ribonuclease P protein component [unclassified Gemella]|uniref:ribonuclease P protein component n=1 Tax=unclassified Gemella TaxID=2624949 RepID=UPI001074016E|nr:MULTISPECIES: ribonuclease P protein component [unclassified Gemella]MBF0710394.1 ribonuclease P protein component [Gemella sp. GL1.1]MBF0747157.1 ribonuclease P protein component [Gemella sp. 19428wG2_WT2a]NYS27738.1 ribonuclease P protein component [Gemella sp. GL1]TFU58160.1 ribonuclease P protein component [Gemella sp. WT2a]